MKLQLTIEVDAVYDDTEAVLEFLEMVAEEGDELWIRDPDMTFPFVVTKVTELPAVGRTRKEDTDG
jgi:hypothetical protein